MVKDRFGNVREVLRDGFEESFSEAAPGGVTIHTVGESRVMAGDEVGDETAELGDVFIGALGAGGGMVHFTGEVVAVQILGFGREVGLPLRSEFPEVVPETGETAPVGGGCGVFGASGEECGGEVGGEV